jgi:hypothetical protein
MTFFHMHHDESHDCGHAEEMHQALASSDAGLMLDRDVRFVAKADERRCSNLAVIRSPRPRESKHGRRRLIRNWSVAKAGFVAKMAGRLRQPAAGRAIDPGSLDRPLTNSDNDADGKNASSNHL